MIETADVVRQACEGKPKAPPINRRMLLTRIAADTAEPYSVRHDARRLLEVSQPREFNYRFAEFLELRQTYMKENKSDE